MFYLFFRGGMTEDHYYTRSDNYEVIVRRKEIKCFQVPMVHTAVLISLKHTGSDLLTYDPTKLSDYTGPNDDIITFALSAEQHSNTIFQIDQPSLN